VIYLGAVGLSVLFFVGLYLVTNRKPRPPKEPKQPEPPRWHKWFDDPV
jgi:hypothetical protein